MSHRISASGAEQLTLGELIRRLEALPLTWEFRDDQRPQCVWFDFGLTFPGYLSSWRGSYAELAITFQSTGEWMTAERFLAMLRGAVKATFPGWKGGEYRMFELTPLWVANPGDNAHTAAVGVRDTDDGIVIDTAWCEF